MYLEAWQLPRHRACGRPSTRPSRSGALHPRAGAAVVHPLAAARDPLRLGAGLTGSLAVERRRVDVHPLAAAQPSGRVAAAAAGRSPRWGPRHRVGLRHDGVHAAPDDVVQRALRAVRRDRRPGRVAAVHLLHHRRLDRGRRRVRPGAGGVGDPAALPVDRGAAAPRPGARARPGVGVGVTGAGAPSADDP